MVRHDDGDDGIGIELTRRRALAALGTVGVASAGAGLGTSAYFSDTETFEDNALAAGSLDVKAAYSAHYSDWQPNAEGVPEGQGVEEVVMYDGAPNTVGSASEVPEGLTGLPANDAWLLAVSDPETFLDNTQYAAAGDASCPDGTDADDLDQPVIELDDVKPGDFGEVTVDFAICDNPGYVFLDGTLVGASENGVTEPEADDPDEEAGVVELLDVVRAAVWVDDGGDGPGGNADGNNYQNGGEEPVAIGSLADVLGLSANGDGGGPTTPLDGDIAPEEGGGSGDVNCFSAETTHSIALAWWVPVDHGNEIQTDSATFSFGLYTEQCRHNDGEVAQPSGTPLRLLHDTHVHGRLGDANELENAEHYFGLMDFLAAGSDHAMRVGAGDDLGSSALSSVFEGEHVVETFEAGDLSHDTFGNHDFDFGPDVLRTRIAETEGFRWVSANTIDETTGDVFGAAEGARQFDLVDTAGVTVGVTGILTERAREVTSLGPDTAVRDPAEALAEVVPEMRSAGADVVVVLSHVANDLATEIAADVDGIDVIVGDDAAEVLGASTVNDTVLAFVGDGYDHLGEFTLYVDGDGLNGYDFTLHETSEAVDALDVDPDPAVEAVANSYRDQVDSEVIGVSEVELNCVTEDLRTEETNMGNFVADTVREDVGSDVVIQNGGGIRTDTLYPAGEITDLLIRQILPFGNSTVELEVDGATLREALENGVSDVETLEGRFPQVSGMTFDWDPDAPAGDRVESVTVGGSPLDPSATYTLGTNNFMAGGGDGYDMLTGAPTVETGRNLADAVIDRIETLTPISPAVEGRITRVDAGSGSGATASLSPTFTD